MLYYDLKKLLFHKKSIILIMILLLCQCFTFYIYSSNQTINMNDYQKIYQKIDGLSLNQSQKLLDEMLELDYEKQEVRIETINRIKFEINNLKQYDSYLKRIKKGEATGITAIFKDRYQYAKEVNEKQRKHYLNKNIRLEEKLIPSYGMEALIQYRFIDLFVLIIGIYFIYTLLDREKELGSYNYLKSKKRGNIYNYLSKFIACVIAITSFYIISMVINYIMVGVCYGFPDLSLPIQMIPLCMSVCNAFSLGLGLVVMLLLQMFLYIIMIMIIFGACFSFQNSAKGILVVAIIVFILQIISLSSADINGLLHYLRINNLMNIASSYIQVSYISIFDHAIFYPYLYLVITIIAIITMMIGYLGYKRFINKKAMSFNLTKKQRFHSLFYYEWKKSWINGAGILLLCIFVGLGIYSISKGDHSIYHDDRVIAYYIDTLGATPTSDTMNKIKDEAKRFEALHNKLDVTEDENQMLALGKQLEVESGFKSYCERMNRLNNDLNREVLKEEETRLIFSQQNFYSYLVLLLGMMLIMMGFYSYNKDQASHVDELIKVRNRGNKDLFKIKFTNIYLLLLIGWISVTLFLYLYNIHLFPSVDFTKHFDDLSYYFNSSLHMKMITYIILQTIIQIIVIFMLCYSVLSLMSHSKSLKQISIILMIILVIPILLNIGGYTSISLFVCLFYPFLNITKFIIAIACLLIICIICYYQKRKMIKS